MQEIIYFALANFPLTFTLLGLAVAGGRILKTPAPRPPGNSAEAVLRWFMFFGIGVTFFYNFVCHVFFGEQIAQFIGWAQSPFQAEVGWASLGYAVLGFMAFRPHRALRVGTTAAVACFMLGAAVGHIYQIVTAHNLAPGNAGGMLWYDVLLPLFGFFLLWKTRKTTLLKRRLKLPRPFLVALTLLPLTAPAEAAITETINVPLHYRTIGSGGQKLGIYASIGGGTPQIFEFDTGGAGLYAAYASNDTNKSKWWGTGFNSTGKFATNTYDSGIQYQGPIVEAAVSLFADHHGGTPLVTTPANLLVGQMTNIANTNTGEVLWTPEGVGPSGQPPVDEVFYGDFGMSLSYASKGIVNLIAQLSFSNGIIPGFRVRGHSSGPFLQIGLTAADTNSSSAFYFTMNTNTNAPAGATFTNSGSLFYSEQVFNADMTISNATVNFTTNLGITTDTGASTTIHNANLGGVPDALYVTNNEGKLHLVEGAYFGLSGTNLGGTNVGFFDFVTANNQISIQDNKPGNTTFYLNTGIALFQQYDVIYNLDNGQIGFEPIPEPSTWALLGLSALLLVAASRRSILNKRKRS